MWQSSLLVFSAMYELQTCRNVKDLFMRSSCCTTHIDKELQTNNTLDSPSPSLNISSAITFKINAVPFYDVGRQMSTNAVRSLTSFQQRNNLIWETKEVPAEFYEVTIKSFKLCESYEEINGTIICRGEVVACNSITLDVTKAQDLRFCDAFLTHEELTRSYRYVLGTFDRHVRIKANTSFSNNITCYTDENSSLNGTDNITLSNAIGVYAPHVNLTKFFNSTIANVYFYSSVDEKYLYLCRNFDCSESIPVEPFGTDQIINGTIGGNPTDVKAIGDIRPNDDYIQAIVEINGTINNNTKQVNVDWDISYGAIFEMVSDLCTVSSYAINIKVTPLAF